MKKMIIQITSGKGPAECCRVVACVQSLMMKQAKQQGIQIEVLENKAGELNGTLLSATMMAVGAKLDVFIKEWAGTIQWTAPSPYRKYHKRKNWFVGVVAFDVKELMQWNAKDVKVETCRSSGPGGQNVNKVETQCGERICHQVCKLWRWIPDRNWKIKSFVWPGSKLRY